MKRALVLTAGGVTGALYEVGVLRALEEGVGPPAEAFDLFLGVSAGASVAAFVAQGILPSRLQGSSPVWRSGFFAARLPCSRTSLRSCLPASSRSSPIAVSSPLRSLA